MKMKQIFAVCMVCMIFLSGCASESIRNQYDNKKKQCRVDIYSNQEDFLLSVENQETINTLLDQDNWSLLNDLPDGLTPEYKLLVYQEKTLLAGQNPHEERDYELIETIIIFQGGSFAAERIASDIVRNVPFPDDTLTFYYELPNHIMEQIQTLLNT